jgi:hypothetical protein
MPPYLSWLSQPYPFEVRWTKGLKTGFWAGLFVTFFLFFFKPFGTTVEPGAEWSYLAYCAAFGLVTFGVTLLMQVICRLLPGIFNEEKWTAGKEVLFNIVFIGLIGVANLLLAHLLYGAPLTVASFFKWQLFTLAIGIFPTLFGAFSTLVKLQKKYAEGAAEIHPHPGTHTQHKPVVLQGENQNERLALDAAEIAFLEAQDNYVQVFYFEKDTLQKRMLRTTLRKMEDALTDYPAFFRCHRTYVVNFDRVEKVSGNAQGYRLHFVGLAETVPVSRSLNEEVKRRLE